MIPLDPSPIAVFGAYIGAPCGLVLATPLMHATHDTRGAWAVCIALAAAIARLGLPRSRTRRSRLFDVAVLLGPAVATVPYGGRVAGLLDYFLNISEFFGKTFYPDLMTTPLSDVFKVLLVEQNALDSPARQAAQDSDAGSAVDEAAAEVGAIEAVFIEMDLGD